MMAHGLHELGMYETRAAAPRGGPIACQKDRPDDRLAAGGRPPRQPPRRLPRQPRLPPGRLAAHAFYGMMVPLMRLALAVHFRRLHAVHADACPKKGPVLVVANHPSRWTDVVVLDIALRRGLHFLASADQFHPWPRGALLRMYGALPVFDRAERPDYADRNARTFHRCEWLFDLGEGVAIFPEGVSRTDRTLLPLKRGAARLALSYAGRGESAASFAIIPVGLYYSNRTAFRSDVTVSVGEPIDRSKILAWAAGEGEEAERGLTARIADSLRAVLLEVADPRKVALLSVLEPIAAPTSGSLDLESARALAGRIAELERSRPLEYAKLERTARAFERARRSLRVSSRALEEPRNGHALRRRASLVAGAPPALIGAVLHALPVALTRAVTRRYASDPSQAAFARIASAFWLYTFAVAAGAAGLFAVLGHPAWLLILLPTAALSGIFLIAYSEWARSEWEAWRLARMERRHLGLVSRARRLRGWLRRFLVGVRSEEPESPRGATP